MPRSRWTTRRRIAKPVINRVGRRSGKIRGFTGNFEHSDFVHQKVNLPAVAEPAALMAGRRTRLVLKKRTFNGVTVAVARENCLS